MKGGGSSRSRNTRNRCCFLRFPLLPVSWGYDCYTTNQNGGQPDARGTSLTLAKMKTQRFKNLAWWLAATYFAWSLFVYFGTLGREPHSWWPIFLYHLIWPWSWIEESVIQPLLNSRLAPDPKTAPVSVWMLMDYVAGGFYITVGTVWFWSVGKIISKIATSVFPIQENGPNRAVR